MMARRVIVVALEWLCGRLDNIVYPERIDGRWHLVTGAWGCYVFHLAELSERLDERWKTGVWR